MTRLGSIIEDRDVTYATLAARAHLQPRTVRMLATGETPLDNVAVGTIRRLASALSVPVAALLEEEPVYPGDDSLDAHGPAGGRDPRCHVGARCGPVSVARGGR